MGAATSLHRDKMIMRCIHDEITRPLDASDIDTPRGETAKHEVHRLRGLIGSRALGEEAAVELKVAFDEYDTDGSGEVGVEELGRIIKKLGLKRSKQQVQAMVDKVDADGSGEVDFVEYCALLGVTIRGPDDLKDIECCYDKPYGTVMFSEKENRFFYLEGDIDDLIAESASTVELNVRLLIIPQIVLNVLDHDLSCAACAPYKYALSARTRDKPSPVRAPSLAPNV